jgi:hypothetical protein
MGESDFGVLYLVLSFVFLVVFCGGALLVAEIVAWKKQRDEPGGLPMPPRKDHHAPST